MGRPVSRNSSAASNYGENFYPEQQLQPGQQDRIVFLSGDVNEHSISNIITQVISLANQNAHAPIHMIVSTYGGSVDEMFSLYDTMKFVPSPILTVGLGKVMSAGVLLLASGEKGKRLIGKNARIMIHPVSGGSFGNVFEAVNDTKELQRMHALMIDLLVKETSMSKDQIDKIMKQGHDHYITPAEAIKMGVVDKVIGD